MTAGALHVDPHLGVAFVEVEDEPDHVEQLRNELVRVYLATIRAGEETLFHRHRRDTIYLVVDGGVSRSDEPGRPRQHTSVGRSIARSTQLFWLARKKLCATVALPDGAVFLQHHEDHPLVHRVCAARSNAAAMRLVGIELRGRSGLPEPAGEHVADLSLEYRDPNTTVYRARLAPHTNSGARVFGRPCVLVVLRGEVTLGARRLVRGATAWIDAHTSTRLENTMSELAECVLVTLA